MKEILVEPEEPEAGNLPEMVRMESVPEEADMQEG